MHRITFFIRMYGQGYTETLFRAAPFGTNDAIYLENYCQKRMALACTDMLMYAVRGSTVGNPRDITIYRDASQTYKGTWKSPGGAVPGNLEANTNANDATSAMLIRLTDSGTNYRSFPLVGLPEEVVVANVVEPGQNADFRKRLNEWSQSMSSAGLGMKAQGAPSATGRIVKFFPKTEDNRLVCLGITGPVPAPGSYVTLGSVRGFSELNRVWKVSASGAAVGGEPAYIYLSGTSKIDVHGPVQDGVWKAPTYTVAVLNQYSVSRATTRKGGVPLSVVRGRR